MRSSDIRAREAARKPRLELLRPKTREQRIRDEVRGIFAAFGEVDATTVATRPAEEWEIKNEAAEGLQSDGGYPERGNPTS